jgi:hypothetical protein
MESESPAFKLNMIGLFTPESNKKDISTPLISTGMIIKLLINLKETDALSFPFRILNLCCACNNPEKQNTKRMICFLNTGKM